MKTATERTFNDRITLILQALPEDILEEIRTPDGLRLNMDTLKILSIKQRRLYSLSIGRLPGNLKIATIHPTKWLTSLQTFRTFRPPDCHNHLNFYREVVQHCLRLHCPMGESVQTFLKLAKSVLVDGEWTGPKIVLEELDYHLWSIRPSFTSNQLPIALYPRQSMCRV